MAVTSITPRRGGESDYDAETRRYRQQYLIVCDSDTDDHLTIRTSALFLALTQGHYVGRDGSEDLGAFLERGSLRNMEDLPAHWEFDAEFSTIGGETGNDPNNPDNDPLLEVPEVEFDSAPGAVVLKGAYDRQQATQVEFTKFKQGILNSARDLFNPPPEISDYRQVLRISRNEPTFDPVVAWSFQNTLNMNDFWGAPSGYLLMQPIKAARKFKNGRFYYNVRYEMHFKRNGWEPQLLDHGGEYWPGGYLDAGGNPPTDDSRKTPFVDKGGNPIDGLLNGNGDKLTLGDDPVFLTAEGTGTTLAIGYVFFYMPFEELNLGDPDIMVFNDR